LRRRGVIYFTHADWSKAWRNLALVAVSTTLVAISRGRVLPRLVVGVVESCRFERAAPC
jgi:hypothetical protein